MVKGPKKTYLGLEAAVFGEALSKGAVLVRLYNPRLSSHSLPLSRILAPILLKISHNPSKLTLPSDNYQGMQVVELLHVLHTISQEWSLLLETNDYHNPILSGEELVSPQITAKVRRQLGYISEEEAFLGLTWVPSSQYLEILGLIRPLFQKLVGL